MKNKMCYSAQVSIDTFILSLYAAHFIWRWGTPWDLAFWLSFSFMQLVEFFLWRNLHDPFLNRFWSWVALILICFQPFFSILHSGIKHKRILLTAYALLVVWMLWSAKNVHTKVGPRGHLLWQWLVSYPVWVMLAWSCFMITPLFITSNKMAGPFTLLVLLVSWYYYYLDGTWGSMWCWLVTLASFYVILSGIYLPS